jgi:hypothetical protein
MTSALENTTDPDPCYRKLSLPIGVFGFALEQPQNDPLAGLILVQGLEELTLSLKYAADVCVSDRKVSLKIGIFSLALGQPENNSPSGLVLTKGFRQGAALLQRLPK